MTCPLGGELDGFDLHRLRLEGFSDARSVLRLFTPVLDSSGVGVSWQSVSVCIYCLERGTNLGMETVSVRQSCIGSTLKGQAAIGATIGR